MGKKKTTPGDIIRAYRKAKGSIQADIAEEIGVSQQQYQRYESWRSKPRYEVLEKLITVLGIPPQKLFTTGNIDDFYTEFERKINKYAKLISIIETEPKLQKIITAFGRK